jgi:hypothetical protein
LEGREDVETICSISWRFDRRRKGSTYGLREALESLGLSLAIAVDKAPGILLAALEAITMSVAVVEADCAETAATKAEATRALNCILLD